MYIHVGEEQHLRHHVLFIDVSGDARSPDTVGTGSAIAPSQSRLLNQSFVFLKSFK
jgi:hypothetical protein